MESIILPHSIVRDTAEVARSSKEIVSRRENAKQVRAPVTTCSAAASEETSTPLPPFLALQQGGISPKRTDIKTIMILGAGPIVIGQACEFDYSGTQACKALRQEGYRIVLLNSNPATIMTDPGTADRTYVAPMTPELAAEVIAKEKPDALLPTMGGQTALNLAKALAEGGVLEEHGVELIGAKLDAINKAEDRDLFKIAMAKIGLNTPPSGVATTMEEGWKIQEEIGTYPLIIRPAFTLGGTGGGIAYNPEDFKMIVESGIAASSVNQVLIEKSLLGWKEYELEVMRDLADNVVIVCSIENIDPMGVHTGDSITVAPAQSLTDKEYQRLRDASIAIIREIGVECGGSNCQFAINPADGELMVIEMNPRVSRSSALASKVRLRSSPWPPPEGVRPPFSPRPPPEGLRLSRPGLRQRDSGLLASASARGTPASSPRPPPEGLRPPRPGLRQKDSGFLALASARRTPASSPRPPPEGLRPPRPGLRQKESALPS
ncbi:hypothetical protein CYMTET_4231, partial [Cymbomonas tetramitiformis]